LQASGTIETLEVLVAAELSGRVAEVLVDEGEKVQAGDPLLRLDDEVLQAQRQQAETTLDYAKGGVTTAQAGLDVALTAHKLAQIGVQAASLQYSMTLNTTHMAETPARSAAWGQPLPNEFNLPGWYFTKDEQIAAIEAEMLSARQVLEAEQANLRMVIGDASDEDFQAAEIRLANAQAAFLVAQSILEKAKKQKDKSLQDTAQADFDAAKEELVAAQSEYDRILSDQASSDVLEARARLAAAHERYETTRDRWLLLLTGDQALQVQAAEIAKAQANANLAQAEASLTQASARLEQARQAVSQAQAALGLIDVQLGKLVILAPASGIIMTRNVQPGEVIMPGASALTIGQLDDLTLTVYVPEDRYGEIKLGQKAQVQVDSFPDQVFTAVVTHIADQAEFTPRNVSTAEGRRSTVYAIELSLENQEGMLKPGMPADVTFEP
jgi:HlyD family secretion protein